jgi:prepilin-type N-terminal cleavage/methylation domain-containing protein
MTAAAPTTRRAFSLMELVVVLAIVAITAAIAAPRYANAIARYRAETAARRVAADLAYARSLARQTSADQTVVFDPPTDVYTLAGVDDPDRPGQPYTVALADRPYHADLTAASFGGVKSVTFDGFGTPSSGGTVTIRVGDYLYTLTVEADTGAVTEAAGGG